MNLGTFALATVLVGATLAGCSAEAEPDGEAGAEPTAGASPTEEAAVDPLVVPTLPDGRLTVQTVVRGRTNARADDSLNQGQVLATEDLVLVLPDTQVLIAVDRETGKIAWKTELKGGEDRSNGACQLAAPPAGATAVVVFSGLLCGQVDSYSLEDGSFIEHSTAPGSLSPSAVEPVSAGGAVFWADEEGIHRIEPDGTSDLVVATVQLGLKGYRTVDGLTTIAGSDILVAHSFRSGGSDESDYYGLQVSAEGDLEEVWRRDTRQVHGAEVYDISGVRGFMSGVLVDTVERGVVTPRMLMLDPETGRTDDRTFVLERDPPGGYPAWIEGDFPDEIKVDPDGQVFGPAGAGGFGYNPNVVRYDLAENDIAWAWEPPFPGGDLGASGQALAVSEDGQHVYALWSAYDETRLVELDYETGRQQRVWPVPAEVGDLMQSVHGMLVGDQLVLSTAYTDKYGKAYAVMLTIE